MGLAMRPGCEVGASEELVMKPQNLITQIVALVAMSALFVNCSGGGNGFSDTAPNNTSVMIPSGGTGTTTPSTPSSIAPNSVGVPVTMNLTSDSALSTYSLGGVSSGSQISNLQIGVSVSNYDSSTSGGAYGGTVTVSYYANGYWHTGVFQALNATTPGSIWDGASKKVQNLNHAAYNKWFTQNGQSVFHGFYADPYGAIMLVITGGLDLGDGNGVSSLTGEIWFKNYATSAAYNYPNPVGTPCWFLSLGQYECRTFLENGDSGYGNLMTTSVLTPDQSHYTENKNPYVPATPARGWQKLGTFTGLNRAQGFGQ
jgi:hypothetical protein